MRIWSIPFIAPPCARAKVPRVKHSTARDAPTTCAAGFRLYRRLSASGSLRPESLERHDPKEAVRWLFSTFERHVLRRVDAVNAQYLPQDALPAILAPLRDDFHLLPWADKTPETTGL